jgi:hypothetical protein
MVAKEIKSGVKVVGGDTTGKRECLGDCSQNKGFK